MRQSELAQLEVRQCKTIEHVGWRICVVTGKWAGGVWWYLPFACRSSQVGEFGEAVGEHQHVGRLEVLVDDAIAVELFESDCDVMKAVQTPASVESADC